MIWSILSVAVCLALTARLLFFTGEHRRQSRFFYRVVLLLSAVYAFDQVLDFVYFARPVSPLLTLFHLALFVGAFFLKPHHLPWNQCK